jgi:hypothetical protein
LTQTALPHTVGHITGEEKRTIQGPARYVLALAVSPDGAYLAMGGGSWQEFGEVKLIFDTTIPHLPSLSVFMIWA